jgi:DNA-binding IclR family transcriptional regulator
VPHGSIGHRTGLFDAMRNQPSMTSEEIAARAGLNERYVREWLGAMVTSGIVAVDADAVPLVPGLVDQLRRGIRVLDVGCRTMIRLAELFPSSRFVGIDLHGRDRGGP